MGDRKKGKQMKETKELLKALLTLAKVVGKELKDGAQLSDVAAVFNEMNSDPVKKKEVEDALEGIKDVDDELKEISLSQGLELAMIVMQELPNILEAFKKEES